MDPGREMVFLLTFAFGHGLDFFFVHLFVLPKRNERFLCEIKFALRYYLPDHLQISSC